MKMPLHSDMLISPPSHQKGVGLVEVLVSLLLLAVAALGYSALQARAIGSTDESLTRTHAITLLRSAAEKMRTNGLGVSYSIAQTPASGVGVPPAAPVVYEALDYYQELFNQATIPTKIAKCSEKGAGCTLLEITQNDVYEIRTDAKNLGIKIGMTVCPGTDAAGATRCLIASWNATEPKKGTGNSDCMKDSGVYHFSADCIYMEAY